MENTVFLDSNVQMKCGLNEQVVILTASCVNTWTSLSNVFTIHKTISFPSQNVNLLVSGLCLVLCFSVINDAVACLRINLPWHQTTVVDLTVV